MRKIAEAARLIEHSRGPASGDEPMHAIAVIGASGFIGQALVVELLQIPTYRVKVLSRPQANGPTVSVPHPRLEIVAGDLRDPSSLSSLFEEGCDVVNLAYMVEAGEAANLAAIRNLVDACTEAAVRRLVHCSTAVVVGRCASAVVTEEQPCAPVTEYATTKLRIEKAVAESALDTVILRPTAVFGPTGKNLEKLAHELTHKGRVRNYLKSCLFGPRRMNLVSVSNVVAAILFAARHVEPFSGDVFIVSDADCPLNNYVEVERVMMRALGIPDYRLPRLSMPSVVLETLLGILGRDGMNPRMDYSPHKLLRKGFERPVNFEQGLATYAAWYASRKALENQVIR
ncbi:MAG: Nucleoside-diphosphate-sugar epimerase [Herminiimonas sp.]|nr:Nucleoside-diphosphate-sugar epimerase [Herminiimonas sp.]